MSIDVSVVVVTYRCRDAALACLASIVQATHATTYELVVLDNASNDDTVEAIRREFPDAQVLGLDENVGFARGVNRAAERASGEFILLLNPDTIVHEASIDRLVAFARARPGHGLYGGRAFNPDGTLQPGSCWGKPTVWSLFCFATMLSTAFKGSGIFDPESLGRWRRDSVREVDIVTGCLLLAPAEVWRALGGFDERYFMYGEDADLSLRAARLGFRPIVTPEAVITHEIGVSSSTRPDKLLLLLRGKVTLVRQHWPTGKRQLGVGLITAGVALRALLGTLGGRRRGRDVEDSAWRSTWRARREWRDGYPAPPGAQS